MTSLTSDSVRPARVSRVRSVNQIELDIDLGFGVHVQKVFTLHGVHVRDVPVEHRSKAVHCLVVLLGGKRVFVQPDSLAPDARFARLYLAEKIHGSPVGLVQHAPGFDRPILDVSMFFAWLADSGFALDEVTAALNGRAKR